LITGAKIPRSTMHYHEKKLSKEYLDNKVSGNSKKLKVGDMLFNMFAVH